MQLWRPNNPLRLSIILTAFKLFVVLFLRSFCYTLSKAPLPPHIRNLSIVENMGFPKMTSEWASILFLLVIHSGAGVSCMNSFISVLYNRYICELQSKYANKIVEDQTDLITLKHIKYRNTPILSKKWYLFTKLLCLICACQ